MKYWKAKKPATIVMNAPYPSRIQANGPVEPVPPSMGGPRTAARPVLVLGQPVIRLPRFRFAGPTGGARPEWLFLGKRFVFGRWGLLGRRSAVIPTVS